MTRHDTPVVGAACDVFRLAVKAQVVDCGCMRLELLDLRGSRRRLEGTKPEGHSIGKKAGGMRQRDLGKGMAVQRKGISREAARRGSKLLGAAQGPGRPVRRGAGGGTWLPLKSSKYTEPH